MAELFTLDYSLLLLLAIAAMAVLYSSVGHGGASGYLAAMVFWGLTPQTMRPAALTMNIVVCCWLLYRFQPYKLMPHKLFWPLVLSSTPMAFIGGLWRVEAPLYHLLVGVLLVIAALRMFVAGHSEERVLVPPNWRIVLVGAALGLMAGITGIGGGVFLSPLILMFGWCTMRQSTAVAAGFILLNSVAGLAGYVARGQPWPDGVGWLALAAFAGCLIGAELAARRAAVPMLKMILGVVLLIAGLKMAYTVI